jgi:hypothetical protein
LDITPILNRELLTATRKTSLWGNRRFFAGTLLTIILATFATRYYRDQGQVSDQDMMASVALQALGWMLIAHTIVIVGVFWARAAPSIALEKDRRTLDFLLATPLSNAEIVLGKLAACMIELVAGFAAGLPIMLMLHPLGGIDLRLARPRRLGLLVVCRMARCSVLRSRDLPCARTPAARLAIDRERVGPDQQPDRSRV